MLHNLTSSVDIQWVQMQLCTFYFLISQQTGLTNVIIIIVIIIIIIIIIVVVVVVIIINNNIIIFVVVIFLSLSAKTKKIRVDDKSWYD